MKKIFVMFAVAIAMCFAACGGRQAKAVEATEPETEVVTVDECDECCGADAEDAAETVTEEVVEAE